jgi:PAS domain S-box-containing protein
MPPAVQSRTVNDEPSPAAAELPSGVLDAVADLVVTFGPDGSLESWNRAASEATGSTDGSPSSLTTDELFADGDAVRAAVDTALEAGQATVDATVVTADDDEAVYELTATVHADESTESPRVVAVGRDVTEERRRGRERDRYEAVLESLPDAVYAVEPDGTIAYVNERYAAMKGAPREELLGTDIDRWVTDSTAERADELRTDLRRDEREVGTVEYEFVTADGERFPAELRFCEVTHPDSDLGRAGTIRDVTERAERERRLEAQNERLDEFAAIVSHDLRNPLNVAEGWLEVARETTDGDDALGAVADAHGRMRALIDDLLTLARHGQSEPELAPVSLPTLVTDCWPAVAGPNATVAVETDATVVADERQLRRLLENLFRNSVEHGSTTRRSQARGDGAEHGSTGGRQKADDETADDGDGHGGDVTVTVGALADGFFVEDDGPGIDPDDRDQVFDAGYSTSSEGTGFGLRIVREIVDAHGWDITVTEGTDGGARFEVRGVSFD